jgi:hypothetical protein
MYAAASMIFAADNAIAIIPSLIPNKNRLPNSVEENPDLNF